MDTGNDERKMTEVKGRSNEEGCGREKKICYTDLLEGEK